MLLRRQRDGQACNVQFKQPFKDLVGFCRERLLVFFVVFWFEVTNQCGFGKINSNVPFYLALEEFLKSIWRSIEIMAWFWLIKESACNDVALVKLKAIQE